MTDETAEDDTRSRSFSGGWTSDNPRVATVRPVTKSYSEDDLHKVEALKPIAQRVFSRLKINDLSVLKKDAIIDELEKCLEELEKEHDQSTQLACVMDQVEGERNLLLNELDTAFSDLQTYMKRQSKSEEELSAIEMERDDLSRENEMLKAVISGREEVKANKYREDNRKLQESVKELEKKNTSLVDEINDLYQERQTLISSLLGLNSEKVDNVIRKESRSSSLTSLHSIDIAHFNNNNTSQQLYDVEALLKDNDPNEIKQVIEELSGEVVELKSAFARLKDERDRFEEEHDKIELEHDKLDREYEELHQTLEIKCQDYERAIQEKNEKNLSLSKLSKEKRTLQKQVETLREKNRDADSKNETLSRELGTSKRRVKQLESLSKLDLQHENENLQTKNSELQNKLIQALEERDKLTLEIERVRASGEMVEKTLSNRVNSLEIETTKLRSGKNVVDKMLRKKGDIESELKGTCENLKNENRKLSATAMRVQLVDENRNILNEEVFKQRETIESLKNELAGLRDQREILSSEREALTNNFPADEEKPGMGNEQRKDIEFLRLLEKLASLSKQLEHENNENRVHRESIEKLDTLLKNTIEEKRIVESTSQETIQALQVQLKSTNESSHKQTESFSRKRIESFKSKFECKECKAMRQQIEQHVADKKVLSTKNEKLNAEVASLKETNSNLEEIGQAMKSELHRATMSCSTNVENERKRYSALLLKHDQFVNTHRKQVEQNKDITTRHGDLYDTHDTLVREHNALQEKHDLLNNKHLELTAQHNKTLAQMMHENNQQRQQMIDEHEKVSSELNERIAKLEQEKREFLQMRKSTLDELDETRESIETLNKTNETLNETNRKLGETNTDLVETNNRLVEANARLTETNNEINQALRDSSGSETEKHCAEDVERLKERLKQLHGSKEKLEKDYQYIIKSRDEEAQINLTNKIAQVETERKALDSKYSLVRAELDKMKRERDHYTITIDTLRTECTNLHDELKRSRQASLNGLTQQHLQQEKDNLKVLNDQLNNNVKQLLVENKALLDRISRTDESVATTVRSLRARKSELQIQVQNLESENRSLKQQAHNPQQDSRVAELENVNREYSKKLQESEGLLLQLQKALAQANDIAMQKTLEGTKTRRSMEKKIDALISQNVELKRRIFISSTSEYESGDLDRETLNEKIEITTSPLHDNNAESFDFPRYSPENISRSSHENITRASHENMSRLSHENIVETFQRLPYQDEFPRQSSSHDKIDQLWRFDTTLSRKASLPPLSLHTTQNNNAHKKKWRSQSSTPTISTPLPSRHHEVGVKSNSSTSLRHYDDEHSLQKAYVVDDFSRTFEKQIETRSSPYNSENNSGKEYRQNTDAYNSRNSRENIDSSGKPYGKYIEHSGKNSDTKNKESSDTKNSENTDINVIEDDLALQIQQLMELTEDLNRNDSKGNLQSADHQLLNHKTRAASPRPRLSAEDNLEKFEHWV